MGAALFLDAVARVRKPVNCPLTAVATPCRIAPQRRAGVAEW